MSLNVRDLTFMVLTECLLCAGKKCFCSPSLLFLLSQLLYFCEFGTTILFTIFKTFSTAITSLFYPSLMLPDLWEANYNYTEEEGRRVMRMVRIFKLFLGGKAELHACAHMVCILEAPLTSSYIHTFHRIGLSAAKQVWRISFLWGL